MNYLIILSDILVKWHVFADYLNKNYTQRNLFDFLKIKPKSDCIHHVPIDFEPNEQCLFAVPDQSENGKYNPFLDNQWKAGISLGQQWIE